MVCSNVALAVFLNQCQISMGKAGIRIYQAARARLLSIPNQQGKWLYLLASIFMMLSGPIPCLYLGIWPNKHGMLHAINRDSLYFGFLLRGKNATRRTKSEREEVFIEQTR